MMMINRWRIGVMVCVLAGAMAQAQAQDDDDAEVDAKQAPRWAAVLAAPAPSSGSPEQRAAAYVERIRAARMLDQPERERAEIDAGLQAVGADHRAAYGLLNRQAQYHADRGDFIAALRAREQALRVAATPGQEFNELTLIVSIQSVLRDRSAAAATLARAQQTMQRLRALPNWGRFGDLWQAKLGHASAQYQRLYGSLAESEAASRACIASMRTHLGKTPDGAEPSFFFLVDCTRDLAATLLKSGRLDEAAVFAVELRELARDYAERQGRFAFAARLAPVIVQVAIERGRFDEAGATIDTAIARLRKSGAGEGSLHMAQLRLLRGQIEMLQRRWAEADEVFAARRAGLLAQRDQGQRLGVLVPEWAYVQLQLGQKDKALDMLNRIVAGRTERFGSDTLPTWEARGFRAIALAANGQRDAALREFAAAVPRIIELGHGERTSADAGLWRSTRLNWVFEGYLSLLAEVASRGERPGGLDPVDEGFRLSDLIRGSTVQRALATAASRAVITDPALAELARQYHDQQRDVASLSDGLGNLLSRGRVSAMDGVVARIRGDLETLRGEQVRVQRTIAQRFPAYASLIEPRPPGIADVQALLRPGEVLLSVLTGATGSYVWAVPKSGAAAFAVVPVGATQVARQVAGLRRTLDPTGVEDATRIRPYPFDTAHALYRQFIAPVEATLQGATSLIVVPHGELGQMPFAALTTAAFVPTSAAPGFDDYAQAPWLAKRMATSQLPSTTALLALRSKASAGRAERAYVAFADPLFSLAAPPSATPAATPATLAARNPPIRATAAAGLAEDGRGPTSRMHLLEPLPETAAEVREIAQLLGADEQRDLFLRERASERNVKTADLMRYRTVMFATHGLQPGQLPGLSQPALALSNPLSAGPGQPDGEDGLLMLDEILGLRLQADWVVLSACSTASPDALSAEAVSGLGRAFFFAGARALLVTGWPIESQSARLLTAATFRSSAEPGQRSRAEALRQASLELMRQHADTSPRLGYAHPMFWAAFVIVGDGG